MQFPDVCFTLQLKVPHLVFVFLMLCQSLILLPLFFLNSKLKLKILFILCLWIKRFAQVKELHPIEWALLRRTVLEDWSDKFVYFFFLKFWQRKCPTLLIPFLCLNSDFSLKCSTFHFQTPSEAVTAHKNQASLKTFHRITEQLRLEGTCKDQAPYSKQGLPGEGCTGLCPGGFWASL